MTKKGLIRTEISLTKKSGVDYRGRSGADMQYIRYGSDYMKCDKCGEYLGLWHCIRCALFKKHGCEYLIVCKNCGHPNMRVKGALRDELDSRWSKTISKE